MRAYLSGLAVALALLAAQPAAAATCYQECAQTCCNYYASPYYDKYAGYYYNYYPAPANYVCTQTDYDAGANYYGTYNCPTACNPHECPTAVPELELWYVSHNPSTGDWGFDQCKSPNEGYSPAAAINAYRFGDGSYTSTGQYIAYAKAADASLIPVQKTYKCVRTVSIYQPANPPNVPYGFWTTKYDYFVSTSSYCQGQTYQGIEGPTLATSATEGSQNKLLMLCYMPTTTQAQGQAWSEYRVSDTCSGGTWVENLGYARLEQRGLNGNQGSLAENGECSAANCMGQCGKDCEGILSFHINTSACMAHDQCVCNHGNNIWAWECLGDFALAAVSFVVGMVEQIVQSIIEAIGNFLEAIFDFLFGWL